MWSREIEREREREVILCRVICDRLIYAERPQQAFPRAEIYEGAAIQGRL